MKSIYPALLIAWVFVLFFAVHAHAETLAEPFWVNPFGRGNFFENDQNRKNNPLFDRRVGYNFSKHFSMKTAVELIEIRVDAKTRTGLTEEQFGSPMDRVNLVFYHIDGVYHFMPESRFTPFVVAGLGGAHYSPKASAGSVAAFNVGAGVKYTMTDNIGIRVDVRDYIVTEVMQDISHNVGAMAGITFAFGSGNEKPLFVAQEKVVSAPVEPRGIVIDFEDIHFDFD